MGTLENWLDSRDDHIDHQLAAGVWRQRFKLLGDGQRPASPVFAVSVERSPLGSMGRSCNVANVFTDALRLLVGVKGSYLRQTIQTKTC